MAGSIGNMAPPTAAGIASLCSDHFQAAEGKCPACRRAICVDCPQCHTCGVPVCRRCDQVGTSWQCRVCRPSVTLDVSGSAPMGQTSGVIRSFPWRRLRRPASGQDGAAPDSVFQAVDRLVLLTLQVLGGVAVLFGVLALVFAWWPDAAQPDTAANPRQQGDSVRNVLRDPRSAAVTGALAHEVVSAGSTEPSVDLRALVDGYTDAQTPVWRSAFATFPLELRFRTRPFPESQNGALLVEQAVFAHSLLADPSTWAREVEVWASARPGEDPQRIGAWILEQRTGEQIFGFSRRPVWEVWLRLLSNHGSAEATTLAEFALLPLSASSSSSSTNR